MKKNKNNQDAPHVIHCSMHYVPRARSVFLINSHGIFYRLGHSFRGCSVQEALHQLSSVILRRSTPLDLSFFICKMRLLKFIRSGILGPEFMGPQDVCGWRSMTSLKIGAKFCGCVCAFFLEESLQLSSETQSSVWSKMKK